MEIVKKQLPPPSKKVEKVQQVKKAEAPKPVAKAVDVPTKPTLSSTISESKVVKPAAVAKPLPITPPTPPTPVTPPAPPAPASPKNVSIGGSGVQWSRSPKPNYNNKDLDGQTRTIVVHIEANEKGVVTLARISRSSGLPELDEKILRAVRSSKFKPYKENGVAYPISADQPFELTLNPRG